MEATQKAIMRQKLKANIEVLPKTFTINTLGVKLSVGVTAALHPAKCYIFLT